MKVILLKDVPGTGRKNDIKEVSEGFARNFLIPRKLAALATHAAITALEKEKQHKEDQQKNDSKKYQDIADRLASVGVVISTKIGEKGKAFGSIGTAEIKKALDKQEVAIEEKWIALESPIKTTGTIKIPLVFPHGVVGSLLVSIKPE